MTNNKLPSFTTWSNEIAPLIALAQSTFSVHRIFAPGKYPSWTFVTTDFRLSLKLPETFGEALITYSGTKLPSGWPLWGVSMDIIITNGKPVLDANAKHVSEISSEEWTNYAYLIANNWGYIFSEIPANRNGTYSEDAPSLSEGFVSKFLAPMTGVDAVPTPTKKAPRRH